MHKTYQKKDFVLPIVSIVLFCAVILTSVTDYFIRSSDVRRECLRLHIIASSDSPEDQEVKLKVRDALIKSGGEIFSGEVNAENALEKISPRIGELEKTANAVLSENGFDYKAHIRVTDEYFDVREYDGVTLPAGKYKAFKVVLGQGQGKNWWCVMFPPLCLPAVTKDRDEELYAVFGNEGTEIVKGKKEYRVKFRIVEIIEKIINRADD